MSCSPITAVVGSLESGFEPKHGKGHLRFGQRERVLP